MSIAKPLRSLLALPMVAAALLLAAPAEAQEAAPAKPAPPIVEIKTNVGKICFELWPEKAPRTVNNFLKYVRSGFYEGTIFHRVVRGRVLQGGGVLEDLSARPTRRPVPLETGGRHDKLTVGLARGEAPDSGTSQFFINLERNTGFDDVYAVFGRVIKGNAVVDQIARSPVRRHGPGLEHLPVNPIVIEEVSILPPGERPE